MAYVAVLDACVLHPMQLCDTLLRLADAGFYRPVWSSTILDEMENSIVRRGYPAEAIRARRVAMEEVFPDALESAGDRFIRVVPGAVDARDRHVVATAIAQRYREGALPCGASTRLASGFGVTRAHVSWLIKAMGFRVATARTAVRVVESPGKA